MRALQRIFVLLVSISICGVSLVESFHYFKYQHFTPLGLHADLSVHRRDVGFEGISKLYRVKLTNYGFLPATVSACDFVDVTGQRATAIAHAVEKWNTQSAKWEPVGVGEPSSFCRPYPLGISEAHLSSKRLWPGQSVAGREEATAVRDGFELGDDARFVAFAGIAGSMKIAFPTIAFRIDEHRPVGTEPIRVQH